MPKILIVSSRVHQELSALQLEHCVKLIKNFSYDYEIEYLYAGSYEIPFVVNLYQDSKEIDAFIALGLILKKDPDHYDYIMSHIKYCFSHFALQRVIVGNGIISGMSSDELAQKINSADPCSNGYQSAFNAVHALLQIKKQKDTK